jgi:hypothetical protein
MDAESDDPALRGGECRAPTRIPEPKAYQGRQCRCSHNKGHSEGYDRIELRVAPLGRLPS